MIYWISDVKSVDEGDNKANRRVTKIECDVLALFLVSMVFAMYEKLIVRSARFEIVFISK